jgi:hypothetical protein
MIKNTIDLLSKNEYYKVSERVDIAKGKYEYPTSLKSFFKWLKRNIWQK